MNTAPYNPAVFVPATPEPVDPLKAKVAALAAVVDLLPQKDQGFAKSLVSQYKERGSLSEKQAYWVERLAKNVAPPKPAPTTTQLDRGFAQVVNLFTRARAANLANPKIRLETEDGTKIVLRLAGFSSRYPGNITVTDNGRSFQDRRYFGRIDHETGVFHAAAANTPTVTKLLQGLAADPAKMAALYGHKHSSCCFCGIELKTRESVAMGYGPICADKFGLPWGDVAPSTYTKMEINDNG